MMRRANSGRNLWREFGLGALVAGLAMSWTTPLAALVVVNDSWADGGLTNGADPLDTAWFTSAAAAGIEVSVGSMGMVTGTSGRGIHTVFPTQSLTNVGNTLRATYTFTTPATVGATHSAGFRVGLFDTLGRALNANISASAGSPNAIYGLFSAGTVGLPGYMMDMDNGAGADLSFRQLDTPVNVPGTTPTGRLMGTTTGFTQLSPTGPNDAYTFAANTTYTGTLTVTRISATEMQLIGTLGSAAHLVTDVFDSADFGMLAFWANSNVFGTANTVGAANNGIDFSNVTIEYFVSPVPEASSMVFGTLAVLVSGAGALYSRRRRTTA